MRNSYKRNILGLVLMLLMPLVTLNVLSKLTTETENTPFEETQASEVDQISGTPESIETEGEPSTEADPIPDTPESAETEGEPSTEADPIPDTPESAETEGEPSTEVDPIPDTPESTETEREPSTEAEPIPNTPESTETEDISLEGEQDTELNQIPDTPKRSDTENISSEEEQDTEPLQMQNAPTSTGTDYINKPLGGNTLAIGDDTKLVVMEAGGDPQSSGYYISYDATASGLRSALWDLYQANASDTSYIMYVGANMTKLERGIFADTVWATSTLDVTFASLRGRVDTLVLTGMAKDNVTTIPAFAAPAAANQFATATSGNCYFGCNIILRNIQHNFHSGTRYSVYMNGYDLTLGGNSWQMGVTRYCGGSSSGSVKPDDGTVTMTVYSTGTGISYFYGGMMTGTLEGNTEVKIHNTSSNVIHLYGGGYGGSATNAANVTGNVTNMITGMGSSIDINTTNGLDSFIGGVYYGDIKGKITNTISGPGSFAQDGARYTFGGGTFLGGSYDGDIGKESTKGGAVNTEGLDSNYATLANSDDYTIKNIIDTSEYTYGSAYYIGINFSGGTVRGNIINIVKAGGYEAGSYSGFSCGAGPNATIGGSWANSFSLDSSTGKVGNTVAGIEAAEAAAGFRLYGNITNVIRSGCISDGVEKYYFRGAGWGYVEGNAYSEVGMEGVVYRGDKSTYTHTNESNSIAFDTGFDLVGGGGTTGRLNGAHNSFCIKGDTTLVQRKVHARWTYGGNFGGVQEGNSKIELHNGIVSTCEGAGYSAYVQVGDSRAEVYGGQVDTFLSGGGWYDTYHDGNVSVEVFDEPNTIINASMGGTYGYGTDHYTSGNSEIVVHGGDFSGTAYAYIPSIVSNGFSAGPSHKGTIFGNASVTLDLRGNEHGFSVSPNDHISGGHRYSVGNSSRIGMNEDNTITLNILTDNTSVDLLNGLNIYGDCSYDNSAANTEAGHITINVNAPNANLGGLFATSYPNLSSGRLLKDVEINLVSAGTIQGLSGGNGTEEITNEVASDSKMVNKSAIINVGPQSADPNNILNDRETDMTADGLPHPIVVTGGSRGIIGFTSMTINKRLLNAKDGSIKNGGTAVTVANHGTTYHEFGDVTIQAGKGVEAAGIGVESTNAVFIAGKLIVKGNGTAYVQSPGLKDQVVFTDVEQETDYLTWLKVGNTAASTGLKTNWFGASEGWYVFTLNPRGRNKVGAMSPGNLRGLESTTGKIFVGDTYTTLSATDGYTVAIPALIYTWEVTEGEGMISHNAEVSTQKPDNENINSYGSVPANTPSKQGMLAILIENMIEYPTFSFIPDAELGEWVKGVQIHRSDEYITLSQHQNCFEIKEQSISDYNTQPIVTWEVPQNDDDKYYAFDITAQYTNDTQLTAQSVIITETEAAAITSAADIIAYNQAEGRPFLASSITEELISDIGQQLDEGHYMRKHQVAYTVGDTSRQDKSKQITVNVIVVKDGTELSEDRSYGVFANDAMIRLNSALALSEQSELDNRYTHAIAILADGTTATPTIDNAAISTIKSTTTAEMPKDISVTYTYAPDESSMPVAKNVTVTVVDTSITIEKYGVQGGSTALSGAKFTIERWDSGAGQWVYIKYDNGKGTWSDTASGDNHYTQTTAGEGGTTTFTNLPLGKYQIKEVVPPTGYTLLRKPIVADVPYTITNTNPHYDTVTYGTAPDYTETSGDVTIAYYHNITYTLINTAAINLPPTGSEISPVMFLLAGLGITLLAAAGYIGCQRRAHVSKKQKKEQKL